MVKLKKYIGWMFVLGVVVGFLGSCTTSTNPIDDLQSVMSYNNSSSEELLEQNVCVWGWVLEIDGTPVDSAIVYLYEYTGGSWNLLDTYVTDEQGYFQEYYIYSIVDKGDTLKFKAVKGDKSGEVRLYGEAMGSTPCLDNDVQYVAHDTIYLDKANDIIIW